MTDLASPPPLQDHRFGEMIKGRDYAYARGLTISPTHLPTALDAMEDDGWTLMAIFGDTKSDRVGFIFKRHPDSETKTGWQCPSCKRVWRPDVEGCIPCNAAALKRESAPSQS